MTIRKHTRRGRARAGSFVSVTLSVTVPAQEAHHWRDVERVVVFAVVHGTYDELTTLF